MEKTNVVMAVTFTLLSAIACAAPKKVGDVVLEKILEGEQGQGEVTLDDVKTAYVVLGEYIVPLGKSLTIKEGVVVLFNKGAGMTVQGEITVQGVTNAPVIFKGKATGIGFWSGITVEKSSSSEIACAVVTGARTGINLKDGKPAIRKSLVYNNMEGIRCQGASAIIEDCVIIRNRGDGCICNGSGSLIENCEISNNSGWGVFGHYCARPTLNNTIVSNNKKGGIYCNYNKSEVTAHGCSIFNNKGYDVVHGDSMDWDFMENWWGDVATKVLATKGCGGRISKIKDRRHGDKNLGLVKVDKFLLERPIGCGPRECVRIKGVN